MEERQDLHSSGLMILAYRSMDLVHRTIVGVPLAAGNYRVVATNTTSLCSSSVALFTVNDVSVTPVITQNTIINNTNCTGRIVQWIDHHRCEWRRTIRYRLYASSGIVE